MKTAEERAKELDHKILIGQLVKRLHIDFINEQNFRDCVFDQCTLETMNPSSIFTRCTFINCFIHCVDFSGTTITDTEFKNCMITVTAFGGVQAKNVKFKNCDIGPSVSGNPKLFTGEL